jgi:general secretion pathway protein I
MRRATRGFSLLEVILALAILAGAAVVMSEVAGHTLRNARAVRDASRAQLLCETKLAEICAAVAPLEPVESAPLAQPDDVAQPEWFYAVTVEAIDREGMLAVRVTVTHGRSPDGRPLKVSLVRWILDPRAAPAASPLTTSPEPQR